MLSIFKPKPLLSPISAEWIFDAFHWALCHFDAEEFFQRSQLIQPSNDFFPGRVDSVHAKAANIFQHTLNYSGLAHWPFELLEPQQLPRCAPEKLENYKAVRNSSAPLDTLECNSTFPVSYNPQQTLKPGDLAASFAHVLAQHLVMQSEQIPPGGPDYFGEATELLGVFMGFGVLFANSAYNFRGGCGSCYNAQANRQATLSEDEVIFALALYCRLKSIPTAVATSHLKNHLKKSYKRALKQIDNNPEQLARLFQLQPVN